jgi:hypothetical protein
LGGACCACGEHGKSMEFLGGRPGVKRAFGRRRSRWVYISKYVVGGGGCGLD